MGDMNELRERQDRYATHATHATHDAVCARIERQQQLRRARTWLFVPGNRPERFAKAVAAGPGVVVLDLEDAVSPQDKHAARQAVSAWLMQQRQQQATQDATLASCTRLAVRINAIGTPWFEADLAMLRLLETPPQSSTHTAPSTPGASTSKADRASTQGSALDAVLCPKARAHEIAAAGLPSTLALVPIVESAAGMMEVSAIAALPRVQRLAFGALDLALELDLQLDADALLDADAVCAPYLAQLVLCSRAAGLGAPLAGVFPRLHDPQGLQRSAQRARARGCGGMLVIHPNQVAVVEEAFTPSAEELAWARRVLEAAAQHGLVTDTHAANGAHAPHATDSCHAINPVQVTAPGGALSVDGAMVDAPLIARAMRIVQGG